MLRAFGAFLTIRGMVYISGWVAIPCYHSYHTDSHQLNRTSNKMPAAVRAALADAAQTHGGMDEDKARAYISRMEREGRLYEDCWS